MIRIVTDKKPESKFSMVIEEVRGQYRVGRVGGKIAPGRKITWKNRTDSTVSITFPNQLGWSTLSIDPKGEGSVSFGSAMHSAFAGAAKATRGDLCVNLSDGHQYAVYRYSIYICEAKKYAIMNSEPEVIIDE